MSKHFLSYDFTIKLTLILIITHSSFQQSCKEKVAYWKAKFNPLDAENPFTSTGLGLNDLGKYDTCLRGDQDGKSNNNGLNKYAVLKANSINPSIYPVSYVGLCMPSNCDYDEILEIGLDYNKNSTLGAYLNGDLIITTKENDGIRTLNALDYFFLSVLIVYFILGLGLVTAVSALIILLKGKNNNKLVETNDNNLKSELLNDNRDKPDKDEKLPNPSKQDESTESSSKLN